MLSDFSGSRSASRGRTRSSRPTRASLRSCSARSRLEGGAGARSGAPIGRSGRLQGPGHVVAAPDGRIGFAPPAPAWLASAGTGDVLAGLIAALRARGMHAFEAACGGVWLHGRAAEIAGPRDDCRRSRRRHPARHRSAVNELIVRIAARGDGVTSSGRHVAFGVPGDALLDDGALAPGPHHQEPPCRHFPECGGCQLQHVDDEAYRGYLVVTRRRGVGAAGVGG